MADNIDELEFELWAQRKGYAITGHGSIPPTVISEFIRDRDVDRKVLLPCHFPLSTGDFAVLYLPRSLHADDVSRLKTFILSLAMPDGPSEAIELKKLETSDATGPRASGQSASTRLGSVTNFDG